MAIHSFFNNISKFSPLAKIGYSKFKESLDNEDSSSSSNSVSSGITGFYNIIIIIDDKEVQIGIIEIVLFIFAFYLIYINKDGFISKGTLLFAIITAMCCTPCLIIYMLFFFKMNK